MKKIICLFLFVGLTVAALGLYGRRYFTAPHTVSNIVHTTVKAEPTIYASPISYTGEDGKDALTLLKEKTQVEQDDSGLVTSIGGRKADNSKHEFWAFYVNGKEAQVGPADYQTKKGDSILWKIQTY